MDKIKKSLLLVTFGVSLLSIAAHSFAENFRITLDNQTNEKMVLSSCWGGHICDNYAKFSVSVPPKTKLDVNYSVAKKVASDHGILSVDFLDRDNAQITVDTLHGHEKCFANGCYQNHDPNSPHIKINVDGLINTKAVYHKDKKGHHSKITFTSYIPL